MNGQLEMFASTEPASVCGLCVVWNGNTGSGDAWCTRMGRRREFEPACDQFFGKQQLLLPRYGAKRP